MAEKVHTFVAGENEKSLSGYFSFCHLTEVMNMWSDLELSVVLQ